MQLTKSNKCLLNTANIYFNTFIFSIFSIILSLVIWFFLWGNYSNSIHKALELVCIFIGLSIFIIIISVSEVNNFINIALGFGFLIASLFEFLHLCYFDNLVAYNSFKGDLSFRYWFASRLTEIITLLFSLYFYNKDKQSKLKLFIYPIVFTISLLFFINYANFLPPLFADNDITNFMRSLDIIIILISLFALRNIKIKLKQNFTTKYKYLFYSIIMMIISQLSFILVKNIESLFILVAHIFNISSYIFIYKAILESSVKHPFTQVKEHNEQLLNILNSNVSNLHLQSQTILDCLPIPTMIINKEGIISACNAAVMNLVEIELNIIIGMHIQKLNDLLKYSDSVFTDIFSKDLRLNKTLSGCILTSTKKTKYIQITSSPIRNMNNEYIGIIVMAQDISEEKQNEEKLINQEKLALLGQMGATIVHETRNFLTTIKGNSQLIELFATEDRIKEYANKINKNTDEVDKIISDFLNLSKPRELQFDETSINDLVSSMQSTLETSSLMKGIDLTLELTEHERYILCDETQIRQVILNICKNAIEAMHGAINPKLHISTEINEETFEVFIKISDNGKGMTKEVINKIGTAFFTTKKTGTGLGLNVCYQIINAHNGKIEVESQLEKGTTFIITFPYIEEDIEEYL